MALEGAIRVAAQDVEAFNEGDWERTKRLYGERGVYDERATGRRLEGGDQIADALQGWRNAFPDARGTITNAFSAGDQVVQEVTWEGTQEGELETPQGSVPASGRKVTIYAVQVVKVTNDGVQVGWCEEDCLVENRHYFDMLGMLQQLGAMG